MQDTYPQIFTPRAISDGGRLLFSTKHIESQQVWNLPSSIGGSDLGHAQFPVSMSKKADSRFGKFVVQLTRVSVINPGYVTYPCGRGSKMALQVDIYYRSDIAILQTENGAQPSGNNAVATNLVQLLISQAPNM